MADIELQQAWEEQQAGLEAEVVAQAERLRLQQDCQDRAASAARIVEDLIARVGSEPSKIGWLGVNRQESHLITLAPFADGRASSARAYIGYREEYKTVPVTKRRFWKRVIEGQEVAVASDKPSTIIVDFYAQQAPGDGAQRKYKQSQWYDTDPDNEEGLNQLLSDLNILKAATVREEQQRAPEQSESIS